jgi:hypothetical protein
MRFIFYFSSLFILLLSGCTNPAQQTQPDVYYDVADFIKQQITDLSAQKPTVNKAVLVNGKRNQQTTHEVNWNRELELFMQADINKPALRSSYQINRPDSLTYQYTLKPSEEKLTVHSLSVKLDSVTRQPRRIEAVLQTDNPLYSSERHITLECGQTANHRWRVKHYQLSGFQKLPYFDRNTFLVEGKLQ